MHSITANRQQGFTLVEVAIVLVIIGLLLGAILKGQEMIGNSRVKNAVNDINSVKAAYYSYIDRYRSAPGDDGPALANLTGRGGDWASVTTAGDLDGQLELPTDPFAAPTNEHLAFWQAVRAAGFLNGSPAATGAQALPKNAFSGSTGVAALTTQLANFNNRVICMSQVAGKGALAMDTQLDDGNPATGSFRATQQTSGNNIAPGTAATAYSEAERYTVCTPL